MLFTIKSLLFQNHLLFFKSKKIIRNSYQSSLSPYFFSLIINFILRFNNIRDFTKYQSISYFELDINLLMGQAFHFLKRIYDYICKFYWKKKKWTRDIFTRIVYIQSLIYIRFFEGLHRGKKALNIIDCNRYLFKYLRYSSKNTKHVLRWEFTYM